MGRSEASLRFTDTPVRIGVMDSRRPAEVVTLRAHHFRTVERLQRGVVRGLWLGVVSIVVANFALLVVPLPHLHLCTLPLSFIIGPLAGFLRWRAEVRFAPATLACPRCHEEVSLPEAAEGWPARFNCPKCAIMIELGVVR